MSGSHAVGEPIEQTADSATTSRTAESGVTTAPEHLDGLTVVAQFRAQPLIAAAVAAAIPRIGAVAKTKHAAAGQFGYSYADLGAIIAEAAPVLAEHGLALTQTLKVSGGAVSATTILVHSSGEAVAYPSLEVPAGNGPQGIGSAATYARRYSAVAALAIALEDDDGAAAQLDHSPAPTSAAARPAAVSRVQLDAIRSAFDALELAEQADRSAIVAGIIGREVSGLGELTPTEAESLVEVLAELSSGACHLIWESDGTVEVHADPPPADTPAEAPHPPHPEHPSSEEVDPVADVWRVADDPASPDVIDLEHLAEGSEQ